MDNVQFEEPQNIDYSLAGKPRKVGALTKFFMVIGLAKNQTQANYCMLLIIVICLLLIIYINISIFAPGLLQFGPKVAPIPNGALPHLPNGAAQNNQ